MTAQNASKDELIHDLYKRGAVVEDGRSAKKRWKKGWLERTKV